MTLAAVKFNKEVRVGLVRRGWMEMEGRSDEVEIEQASRIRLRSQIALLGMSTSSDLTVLGNRLTLGVLSPGDLQELLDVGDLLRLSFQIRP